MAREEEINKQKRVVDLSIYVLRKPEYAPIYLNSDNTERRRRSRRRRGRRRKKKKKKKTTMTREAISYAVTEVT